MKNKDLLTICIPTYNSLSTIKIILNSLTVQDIFPKIIILDNGSKDGTFEALLSMDHNKLFKTLDIDIRYFGNHVTLRKHQNLDMVRHRFCELVTTKYLMFLDSDVLIPPYCIVPMLEQLEENKTLGMLALKYEVEATHIQLGASITQTKLIKDLEWRRTDTECQCICAAKCILVKGFSVEYYTKTQARHLLSF